MTSPGDRLLWPVKDLPPGDYLDSRNADLARERVGLFLEVHP